MMTIEDGGSYAIKGFLYQFDKSLIEIIQKPNTQFTIENIQDINCENYVIQVKHHSAQDYAPSKIRKPIIQILDLFKSNVAQQYCLYCHFRDQDPRQYNLTLNDLDKILGNKEKDIYSQEVKLNFIGKFTLIFSDNYEEQFLQLIELIRITYSLSDGDLAYLYHSIIRSNLLNIAVIPEKEKRQVKKSDLDLYLNRAEKEIFYCSYEKYLAKSKYEALIKKEYFTFKNVNLNNFERLFVIDYDDNINKSDLIRIISQLKTKYFREKKSPAPYVLLRLLNNEALIDIKRELIDIGILFNDGTQFDGDKFRIDHLKQKGAAVKFVNEDNINIILNEINYQEIYSFYLKSPLAVALPVKNISIQITETDQILNFL